MIPFLCTVGYLIVGLFVSGIVYRLVCEDGEEWWHHPAPLFSIVFFPFVIAGLIVYPILKVLHRIILKLRLEPISLGYRITDWIMTPKEKKPKQKESVSSSYSRVSSVHSGNEASSQELVEAEKEVEELLSKQTL